ncbi:IS3 family transposase [Micromonospora zhanjiangensis]
MGVARACRLTGRSRATHYRRQQPPVVSRPLRPKTPPPSALSEAERRAVLDVLHRDEYAEMSVAQVWARELDNGRYWCSQSTMYRILRQVGESRERRRQATHPPRTIPQLAATGPSQVWSWDITRLKTTGRGVFYHLYVIIDVYSRYVVGWHVATGEDSMLAREVIDDAIARNRVRPEVLHADRGSSMTSKPVAELLADLDITRSYSRPRVSNDNPYSEAQFKTLKYCPAFPDRFDSLEHAREFCTEFFTYYNHEHRHSGIGLHTPASVHYDTADDVHDQRQATLDAAWRTHPDRFTRRPRPPALPCPTRCGSTNQQLNPQIYRTPDHENVSLDLTGSVLAHDGGSRVLPPDGEQPFPAASARAPAAETVVRGHSSQLADLSPGSFAINPGLSLTARTGGPRCCDAGRAVQSTVGSGGPPE